MATSSENLSEAQVLEAKQSTLGPMSTDGRRARRDPAPIADSDGSLEDRPLEDPTVFVDWRSRVVTRSLGTATDRAVQRGQQLITAAGRLVQRSGGDDFTMQEVANEAGLSLRVLYQHFSGKDDLLVALIEESQLVFARLLERHVSCRTDPLDRLGAALYFATDTRQHPDTTYSAAMTRYTIRTSISAPEQLGRARRPVIDVFTKFVADAMSAGVIEPGDAEAAATTMYLGYVSFGSNSYAGNSVGSELPSSEQFIRFCIQGLGAQLPTGWEQRFTISDAEAEAVHIETEYASGTRQRKRRPRAARKP